MNVYTVKCEVRYRLDNDADSRWKKDDIVIHVVQPDFDSAVKSARDHLMDRYSFNGRAEVVFSSVIFQYMIEQL